MFRGETRFAAVDHRLFITTHLQNKEGTPMKKIVVLSIVAAASLGLTACSKSADTTTNDAAMDVNATAAEAMTDINAASANVSDAAASVENSAAEVSNAGNAVTDNASNAM